MSAKEFYRKPKPELPDLPPELWALIMRHATLIPEGIEPEFSSQQIGYKGPAAAKEQYKSFKLSLVTKRNLVRVNKTWYELAIQYLYEYVLLVNSKSLEPLIGALERYQGKEDRGPGWWAHRIDINLREYESTQAKATDAALVQILTRMPNLHTVTFSTEIYLRSGEFMASVLPSLDSCRGTLKFIHFYLPLDPAASRGAWTEFLERHPDLECITGILPISEPSQVKLDKLTTIHSCAQYHLIGACYSWELDLPALRAASYGLGRPGENPTHQNQFFAHVGPQLKLLQVSYLDHGWFLPLMLATSLAVLFQTVYQTCSVLEQVNFSFDTWRTLSIYTPVFPPTVHKIGIRIVSPQISKSMTLALFATSLKAIARQNPHIKTVQFFSRRNVEALQHSHCQLYEGLRVFKETGVVVIDHEGNAM